MDNRIWKISPELQAKYAAPICNVSNYSPCTPWAKKGARISFQYSNDNERLNQCNTPQARVNDMEKDCCKNRGMYSGYRGRCEGYDAYFRCYHSVDGISSFQHY